MLRHRDLAELSLAEREHLRQLLALLRPNPPSAAGPAPAPPPARRADPRRTLRAALRTRGEIRGLARRDRPGAPRKVVLLLDVSGSMEPYADALLRFAHVVTRPRPQAVETFTLGTRLTRVTRELRQRDPEHALRAAGKAIPDWSGRHPAGRGAARRSSTAGDSGARRAARWSWSSPTAGSAARPTLLGEQMARLRRLAHAVVWVNPHAGKGGYAPVQGGIVAALPHLDDCWPGTASPRWRTTDVMRDA